eukprot:TRINITY_DN2586_c1_g2_i1.p1 TRINITY_DN2586_c1_g2~~TRINITY_DN2586_c1_g2_i1.p1  ORF type:complete len:863 (+),score=233.35 TRINITY_DN2586_c1_g2_i1:167-2755(+)
MAETSVCVGVRVRPFNDRETKLKAELCIEMVGPTTIITAPDGKATPFAYDESFWSHDGFEALDDGRLVPQQGSGYADQRYVFEKFGQRVLDAAWEGFNSCLFAYGQTGSGKSYSMVGYNANRGIVPISCNEIFQRIASGTDETRYEVTVSAVEIYNEVVQDLLILPEDRRKAGLEIRESKVLGVYIEGVVKRPVGSFEDVDRACDEAAEHRTVGSTLMNATSSRAHTVLTIEFKQVQTFMGQEQTKLCHINLVDLAGSEKAGQTGAEGSRLKEGAAINKSLSALGNVIEKLAEKSTSKKKDKVIVPYRDSKLTRLLQNALGGSSKTIMICALSPASSNFEETLSTLRYADRAKKIKNVAVVNEDPQERLIRQLREENEALKKMMDEMLGENGVLDVTLLAEKKKEIMDAQEALDLMTRPLEDRLKDHEEANEKMNARRASTLGVPGPVLVKSAAEMKIQVPYMANLNEDMQLAGRIKHEFPSGKSLSIGQSCTPFTSKKARGNPQTNKSSGLVTNRRISIQGGVIGGIQAPPSMTDNKYGRQSSDGQGSSDSELEPTDTEEEEEEPPPEADILLVGVGIYEMHARVTNRNGRCFIFAEGKAAEETVINGRGIAELIKERKEGVLDEDVDEDEEPFEDEDADLEGYILQHGDRIAFGRGCLFVFVDPVISSAENLILSGQVSYSMAAYELESARFKMKKTRSTIGPGALSSLTKALGGSVEQDEAMEELKEKITKLETELRQVREENAVLRSAQAGAAVLKNKQQDMPGLEIMAPQLKKAMEVAMALKQSLERNVIEVDTAQTCIGAVSTSLKAISQLQAKQAESAGTKVRVVKSVKKEATTPEVSQKAILEALPCEPVIAEE